MTGFVTKYFSKKCLGNFYWIKTKWTITSNIFGKILEIFVEEPNWFGLVLN